MKSILEGLKYLKTGFKSVGRSLSRPWGPILLLYFLLAGPFLAPASLFAEKSKVVLRIASFNIKELTTGKLKETDADGAGQNAQVRAAAAIIQKIRPEVLAIAEIDHDYTALERPGIGLEENARRFNRAYLNQGKAAISYRWFFAAPCNSGFLSGMDLDGDGIAATAKDLGTRVYGNDCLGFGTYPGAGAIALLSQYPIARKEVRTFRKFLWKDLPGNHLPLGFYSAEALQILPLSAKSDWDIPIRIRGRTLHFLLSLPPASIYDGEEDRNGRRNFDEIKFWTHYIDNDPALLDDAGKRGGLGEGSDFIILGDLNSFLGQETAYEGQFAIEQLLHNKKIQDTGPYMTSAGALMGNPPGPTHFYEQRTLIDGDFIHRFDYILPRKGLKVIRGGVFWPSEKADPEGARLAAQASDHRLVWLDLRFP